jgi:hypothetical protein
MAAKNQTLSKDFFTNATRMTLAQVQQFLTNVVLNTNPRDLAPIILWGAPGIAKSAIIDQVFGNSDRGVKTVILSQVGPLDSNGLPHIEKDDNGVDITRFSQTDTFGRGKFHLFLDELNNAAPSTLAAAQNLLSSKWMGGHSFEDVHIIAACNPPSTNSLANDLNYPTISRCINIVVDYTLDDFINYAMSSGKVHPAITAFHKKTSGRYLQCKWAIYPGTSYEIPEPMANEPFPCPRSWTLASNAVNALSGAKANSVVDYSLLKPLVEGAVGIQAASEFATTYAYMNRIPDIEKIFDGSLDPKKTKLEDNIAVQFLTMMSCINHCIANINESVQKGVSARVDSDKSPAYKLLAGIHYCIRFMGIASSPELATMTLQAVTRAMRESKMSPEFMQKLLGGIDKAKGLSREDIIQYSRTTSSNQLDIQGSIG